MEKIRVGVIGVGYLGKYHAEKYARMHAVELIGVVDSDRAQAEKIAAALATNAFSDHRDLFGRVDAVSVAVPTPAHFSVGHDFLTHDVDVLIEKPMTRTLVEADELIKTAESRGRILQVGHLERFNPAVIALKDIVHRPMFIESHRLSIFKDRSTDISVVLDLMIHDIDIILNFVNADIKSIHAAGVPVICEHADIANARLEFESGCVANVTASRISTKNERKIRLFQKDAYISVDFAHRDITIIHQADIPSGGVIPGMQIRQLAIADGDALGDELAAFIRAVSTRKVPEVSGQVGRKALEIALIIMDQIHSAIQRYLG
jgi:predicted dehydrogenase